jgi:GNAT superfamily N-acetyltransferase
VSLELSRPAAPFEAELRLCRPDDLPALEWDGVFAHHRAIFAEAFARQGRGEVLMLLALVDGRPVGQAWLDLRPKPDSAVPSVWAVRVREQARGQGLGARLMAEVERLAAGVGACGLELAVETANGPARAFYERLGWRIRRRRQETYSYVTPEGRTVTHALDEWVMGKALDQAANGSPTRA